MTVHCATCNCGETAERWFLAQARRCSTCGWRVTGTNPDQMSVVMHVTDRGAKRYLCRACAEKAGWDGIFTPTSTDRLLKAQAAYQNGSLSLPDYLSEIDRATEEGATDQALRDPDHPASDLPDGMYVGIDPDPNGGSLTTFRINGHGFSGHAVSFTVNGRSTSTTD